MRYRIFYNSRSSSNPYPVAAFDQIDDAHEFLAKSRGVQYGTCVDGAERWFARSADGLVTGFEWYELRLPS